MNVRSIEPEMWMSGRVWLQKHSASIKLCQRVVWLPAVAFATWFPAFFIWLLAHLNTPMPMLWVFGCVVTTVSLCPLLMIFYRSHYRTIVIWTAKSRELRFPRLGIAIPSGDLDLVQLCSGTIDYQEYGKHQVAGLVLQQPHSAPALIYSSHRATELETAWKQFCQDMRNHLHE